MEKRAGGDWAALPSVAPTEDIEPATQLVCDGEIFGLRPDGSGCTHYTWLSGPNPGYGFSTGPTLGDDDELHRTNIRGFLSMIDPKTGYIEEE